MFLSPRRGIVGFMLTIALGCAIGAATYVVSTEVTRNAGEKKNPPSSATTSGRETAAEAEAAFRAYDLARKDYEKALFARDPSVPQKSEILQKAKIRLERAFLFNSPGVAEMLPGGMTASAPVPASAHTTVPRPAAAAASGSASASGSAAGSPPTPVPASKSGPRPTP